MRVFVVNAYEDRKEKYDEERYELYPAIWWEDVTEEQVAEYHFRHNAKMDYRKKVVACSLSHKDLLQKIINEDLKDVFIIEDDAVIDKWDRLKELQGSEEFCYIGGQINAPLMKDFKKFEDIKDSVRDNFCKGINVIDPKEFRLAHTCGYFIPNRRVAQDILSNIPHGKKERAIDTEYISLQKKGKITKFIYPAIVTLYLPDANKGFTYSSHKLLDDQWLY
jgi:GR25 family glycosyltransferase involved in LPS biosynthesis